MKILFINHTSELYGASRSLLALLEGLKQHKEFELHVLVSEEGNFSEYLAESGIAFTVMPFHWAMHYRWHSRFFPKKIWQIWQYQRIAKKLEKENEAFLVKNYPYFAAQNFDLIHSNSSVIDIGIRLAQRLTIPHIWHLREFADEDYNLTLNDPVAFQKHLRASKHIVCISQKIKEHFFKDRHREEGISVIYNPIYSKAVFAEKAASTKGRKIFSQTLKIFAIVGLIHPNKGQTDAIKALHTLNNKSVKLLIAGGGNAESIEKLVKELGLDTQVEILGKISNISAVYQQADAVLMCSKSEAFGRVTVEAMAHKRPVIGLDNAGTVEIIRHQENGLLYRKSYEELAAQMHFLLENPAFAEELAENAWKEAAEKYSTEQHTHEMIDLYHGVLDGE